MTTNYDGIAREYQASKFQLWRAYGYPNWHGFLAQPPIVFLKCAK